MTKAYFILFALLFTSVLYGQKRKSKSTAQEILDPNYFKGMQYRSVGPSRGGRSTAITGIPEKPFTFFMGTTGGGLWHTDDAGTTWSNITDGQIGAGSIGAVEVAPSDINVIYLGTGSACARGNISPGVGLYKSTDHGKTWDFSGLKEAGQIGKILVHPTNPDLVYVAALGNIFRPNGERGLYRSSDGGQSWEKVLFISNNTGIIDMAMNPANPRIIYAAAWRAERKPWTMIDGGTEGGIYRSDDGGDSWKKLEGGLPTGVLGRISITISPVNPNRMWTLIQAAEEESGGIYRSDDGGETWDRINRDHRHRQRGWYYTHLNADPKDENTIYSSNTGFYKSVDGGVNFERIMTPHGDNHGVWINPNNTAIMINCNDGGANVSLNGGKTWSTQYNQATSEFYRLTIDNQFPYRLYAGQQDNTTISVPSQPVSSISNTENWEAVGGGESADVAVHPTDPDIVYAGTYSGEITYYNRKTGQRLQMTAYPHYTEGTEQRDLKYRWQWNFPLFVSTYDPSELYMASNFVHRSVNHGQTWEIISPDLTRSLDKYHDIPGGPVQHDATGVEVYSSVFALEESPHNKGEIWAGSDDGLLHITRDGGKNWVNITPADMPDEGTINKIELSSHEAGRAFVAVYKYRDGDFNPYLFRTNDFGKTWARLTNGNNGIPANTFIRSVAEDPDRRGLIYVGTEFGVFVSFNDGNSWQSLQLNLPVTPVTDMEVYNQDLILSTQGRSFWILDDLTPLHNLSAEVTARNNFLFPSRAAYRSNVNDGRSVPASINFFVASPDGQEIKLEITDNAGRKVKTWSNTAVEEDGVEKVEIKSGYNTIKWNLRYQSPRMVDNFVAMVFSHDNAPGSKAVPGDYNIRLTVGEWSAEQTLTVKADPRWSDITIDDYNEKFELEMQVLDLINESQDLVRTIRSVRKQARTLGENIAAAGMGDELKSEADELGEKLDEIENKLVQNKIETTQDEINYRRVFSNHIARLYRVIVDENNKPTGGMLERWEDLRNDYLDLKKPFDELVLGDLDTFNKLAKELEAGKIILPLNNSR